MKNMLLAAVVAVLASVATVWWMGGGEAGVAKDETAYERVMRTGVLRCGYATWPPDIFAMDANTGAFSGIMYEMTEDLGKRLGLKIEWAEETGWGNWVEALRSKRIDAFCPGVWISADRGKYATFARPVFYNTTYVYVRANETRFDGKHLERLNSPDVRHSVQDGEMTDIIARQDFPRAKVVAIPQMATLADMLNNVVDGKADVVITDPSFVNGYLEKNPGTLRRLSEIPFRMFTASIAVARGETDLVNMIDAALIEMENQGISEGILRKYEPDASVILSGAKPYRLGSDVR